MSKNYTTNIIDLGGRVAGNVSGTFEMVITPNPGYVVKKDDFSALEISNFLILALACGDLTKIAYVWFAKFISEVYLPFPVKNLLSSFLSTLEPTKLAIIVTS